IGFFLVLTLSNRSSGNQRRIKGTPRPAEIGLNPLARRLLIAVALVLLGVELLPILTIIVISFVKEGSWTWQVFPSEYSADNYAKLVLDPRVFEPMQNSIVMSF